MSRTMSCSDVPPLDPNSSSAASLSGAATDLDVKTASAAFNALSVNLALEMLSVGLKLERASYVKLQEYVDEGTEIQRQLRELIDLNGKLTVSDKATVLTEETLQLAKDLEKSGIRLLEKDEKKVSPERLADVKAQISSHSDRLKTSLQNLFMAKIQVTVSDMNSINDTMRMIIKTYDRFMETIIGHYNRTA